MAEPNDNDPPRERPWDRGGGDDRPRRDRDDDSDDRPRRRRDDDDFDDRPRRRRGRDGGGSGGGGTSAVVIVAIIGAVCLGCLVVVGILVGLLLPAVQKVREAAARQSDSNNLKQLTIGTHNFHDSKTALPPAEDQLSWRFHILPFLEQESLYRAMNPKEPWDGPTNKRFASTKIKPFTSTAEPELADTRYRVFVGPNTLYEPGKKPLNLREIPDGTSNTIFIVEAAETVPWPQPKELVYDRNGPLPPLGSPGRRGFLVTRVDGSVQYISDKASAEVLRGGIDPRDGRGFEP